MDGDICHHSNCEFLAHAVIERDELENRLEAEIERLRRNWQLEHAARVNDCEKLLRQICVRNNLMETLKVIASSASSYDADRPDAELAEQIVWSVKRYAEVALAEADKEVKSCR